MDTELSEVKTVVARIDERTMAILQHQEDHKEALTAHEDRDRDDFKEVHHRINRLERRQNWFLGVGSAIMVIGAALVKFFGG